MAVSCLSRELQLMVACLWEDGCMACELIASSSIFHNCWLIKGLEVFIRPLSRDSRLLSGRMPRRWTADLLTKPFNAVLPGQESRVYGSLTRIMKVNCCRTNCPWLVDPRIGCQVLWTEDHKSIRQADLKFHKPLPGDTTCRNLLAWVFTFFLFSNKFRVYCMPVFLLACL